MGVVEQARVNVVRRQCNQTGVDSSLDLRFDVVEPNGLCEIHRLRNDDPDVPLGSSLLPTRTSYAGRHQRILEEAELREVPLEESSNLREFKAVIGHHLRVGSPDHDQTSPSGNSFHLDDGAFLHLILLDVLEDLVRNRDVEGFVSILPQVGYALDGEVSEVTVSRFGKPDRLP